MREDANPGEGALRIDGGMSANDWLGQFLADMLIAPVERPVSVETTALGAAFLAGLATGVWSDLAALEATWAADRRFEPKMDAALRGSLVAGWHKAVARALL